MGGEHVGRSLHVVVATRIFAPEPAAASLRLGALVRALADAGHRVTVLTTTAPGRYVPPPGVRVRRWPVLRDRDGYVRGYLQYLSFDVPLALRLLLTRRPDAVVVERSEEHTSELQSRGHLVCRLLLEKNYRKLAVRDQVTAS